MKRIFFALPFTMLIAALLISCATTYRSREVGFRHPAAYANMKTIFGAQVATEEFSNRREAKAAFGFDVVSAGLLPVQVVMDNRGPRGIEIVPDQTFLIDSEGRMWSLLDRRVAHHRLLKSTEYGRIADTARHSSILGAAGGALIGAAIGVLAGKDVAETTLRGLFVGGAGGAFVGGARELTEPTSDRQVAGDLDKKELRNRPVAAGAIGRGFLFFPAEAMTAGSLRLQLRQEGTNRIETVELKF